MSRGNRLGFRRTLGDIGIVARRELLTTVRRPMFLIFAFVQPVMFVLLFRYVFGGAINTGPVDYVNFLMPGVLVQTAIFGALVTGMGLNEDLSKGVIDRFRSLPMARSAVLVGRTFSDLLRNLATVIVMLAVGFLVGFRPTESLPEFVAAVGLLLLFSYSFSWISALVGMSVKDPETAQSAGFIWVFPLTFASSAFVPASSMPGIVGKFAEINPVTLCVDAVRGLTIGPESLTGSLSTDIIGTIAWSVGLVIVFAALSIRHYGRLQ